MGQFSELNFINAPGQNKFLGKLIKNRIEKRLVEADMGCDFSPYGSWLPFLHFL